MKRFVSISGLSSSVALLALALISCGTANDFLSKGNDGGGDSPSSNFESDSRSLLTGTESAASGTKEPQFLPFDGEDADHGQGDHHHGPGGRGGHKRGGHGGDHHGEMHQPLPAEIAELMKSANAKKDSVLGIDRAKVDAVKTEMKADLQALHAVSANREIFMTKAKEIQDKYAQQLKGVLPAFESLTQEQKNRVSAIHDLQKKVMDACVRVTASDSAECTSAKSALKTNIDAP